MIDKNITTTLDCGNLWVTSDYTVNVNDDLMTVFLRGFASQGSLDINESCHTKQVTIQGLSGFNGTIDWIESTLQSSITSEFYIA